MRNASQQNPRQDSPFAPFLAAQDWLVLDGGLATELEARGHDLDHPLWSARTLIEDPDAIFDVHMAYLRAGADCIIGAGYQASPRGLREAGWSQDDVERILRRTVETATRARDAFWREHAEERTLRPLVAAGFGPFGAYRADGSEFRGNYGVSRSELRDFHAERLHLLHDSGPDLLAVETLPDRLELTVLLELLDELDGAQAWISFCCADASHLHDGTPVAEAAAACAASPAVIAVGVNCTAPRHLDGLIGELRRGAPQKAVVVYPNSGEIFDADTRGWTGHSDPQDFGAAARRWHGLGASAIGGCCRSRPAHIRAIRDALADS